MRIEVLTTPGLGDNSYLLVAGDEAAAVDPQRDIGRFLEAARAHGARIRHVFETHVHNDYVSGALDLQRETGAVIFAPEDAGYAFPWTPMEEGAEVAMGDLRVRAWHTPGHTPEHTSYLVYGVDEDEPAAVFTGGSLMVGGAGRTDLLGPELTDGLTRDQFRSLRRLAALPDRLRVLPTHGGGSFCGAGEGQDERESTIGAERARNAALQAFDEEAFVEQQLEGLLAYPDYYRHIAPINRAGPRPVAELPAPGPLGPAGVAEAMTAGAWLVDGRDRTAFARGHVPGSVNVELGDPFATYVGWIVPFGSPLVLVLREPSDLEEALTELRRVGYEDVRGYLDGGVEAWAADGRETSSYPVAGLDEWCEATRAGRVPLLLDVRQRSEWERGRIPDSRHAFVGNLPQAAGGVPRDREVWVACESGQRASVASSVLDREGASVRLVTGTGVSEFLQRCPAVTEDEPRS